MTQLVPGLCACKLPGPSGNTLTDTSPFQWCYAFPVQEEEEDESRPKKRGRYAKQDDDDFEPVSPLLPCLLPDLLTATQVFRAFQAVKRLWHDTGHANMLPQVVQPRLLCPLELFSGMSF